MYSKREHQKCKCYSSICAIKKELKQSNSHDAFFIFISLSIGYYLNLNGHSNLIWLLPFPICFIMTKFGNLKQAYSTYYCSLLKICRFLIRHYRLITVFTGIVKVYPYIT
jgi:hypothetical protein